MRKSKYEGKFPKEHAFGSWSVVDGKIHGSPAQIDVKCVCGTEKRADVYTLVNQRSTSCGCVPRTGENSPNWKGDKYGGVPATMIYRASHGSVEAKGLAPSLMAAAYNSQDGNCTLTGQALNVSNARMVKIDSNKPYDSGNIAWVHTSVAPLVYSSGGTANAIQTSLSIVSKTNPNIFEQMGFKPTKEKK